MRCVNLQGTSSLFFCYCKDMNSGSDYMDLIVFNSKKGCETFIIRVRNAV